MSEKIVFRSYLPSEGNFRLLVSERGLQMLKTTPEAKKLLDPTSSYEFGLPTRLQAIGLAAGVEQYCATQSLDGFALDLGTTLVVCRSDESAEALATLAKLREQRKQQTPQTPQNPHQTNETNENE